MGYPLCLGAQRLPLHIVTWEDKLGTENTNSPGKSFKIREFFSKLFRLLLGKFWRSWLKFIHEDRGWWSWPPHSMPNYSQQALLFRHQLLGQPTAMLPTAMLLFRHKSTLVMYKTTLNFTYLSYYIIILDYIIISYYIILSCALKLSYERCFSEIQHFF